MFNRLTTNLANLLPEPASLGWEGLVSVQLLPAWMGQSKPPLVLDSQELGTWFSASRYADPYLQLTEMENDASLPITIPTLAPWIFNRADSNPSQHWDWCFLDKSLTHWWATERKDVPGLPAQMEAAGPTVTHGATASLEHQVQGARLSKAQSPSMPISFNFSAMPLPSVELPIAANLPPENTESPSVLASANLISTYDQPLTAMPSALLEVVQADPSPLEPSQTTVSQILAPPGSTQQQNPMASSASQSLPLTPAEQSRQSIDAMPQTTINLQGGIHVQIAAQKIDRNHAEETARMIAGHVLKEINRITDRDRFRRGLPPNR